MLRANQWRFVDGLTNADWGMGEGNLGGAAAKYHAHTPRTNTKGTTGARHKGKGS